MREVQHQDQNSNAWEQADEIHRLYTEEQKTVAEIGMQFGVSVGVISRILVANGVKLYRSNTPESRQRISNILKRISQKF